MKRLVICAVLFAACIALSIYSYLRMERMRDGMFLRVDEMLHLADTRPSNLTELEEQASALEAFWKKERDIIIHIVRRNYLDAITISAAKLPQLAHHGDFAGLAAELNTIRRLTEDLYAGEILRLENIM